MEEQDLKGLTAEEGKRAKAPTAQKATLQKPSKREAYNQLMKRSASHAVKPVSQTPKSNALRASRLVSHQLSPSPKKETKPRSSASVPRLDLKKPLPTDAKPTDTIQLPIDSPPVEVLPPVPSTPPRADQPVPTDSVQPAEAVANPFPLPNAELPQMSAMTLAEVRKLCAGLKEQVEACVAAISPHFLQGMKGKPPPVPDAELAAYCFLALLRLRDEDLDVPDSFKVMHHRTWKSIQFHCSHPGKIVQAAKSLPQAIKHGKLTSPQFQSLDSLLQSLSLDKVASDESAMTMLKLIDTARNYAQACESEREKETQSLQFLKLRDASPRRKLLTSLLNRSSEESREDDQPVFRDSLRVERAEEELEESKAVELPQPEVVLSLTEVPFMGSNVHVTDDLVVESVQPVVSNRESEAMPATSSSRRLQSPAKPSTVNRPKTTPVKPAVRKQSQERILSPKKSPNARLAAKPEPVLKSTPKSVKKRPVLKPKPEPEPVVDTPEKIRFSMLLDVKLRVFLQEKVVNAAVIPEPETEEDCARLMEAFAKELESCGENVEGSQVSAYIGKMNLATIVALVGSIKSRQMDAQQSPDSWTHREIQRQKDRMSQTLTRLQLRKSLS